MAGGEITIKYFNNITNRGFKLIQFKDTYDELCDIQESSNIEPHIWLGTHSPNPKILASKLDPNKIGWVDYQIPSDILISHRMHLNRKQCISFGLNYLNMAYLRNCKREKWKISVYDRR